MSIPILWARLERGILIGGRSVGAHGPVRSGQEGVRSLTLLDCGALLVMPDGETLGAGVVLPATAWRELGVEPERKAEPSPEPSPMAEAYERVESHPKRKRSRG